MMINGVDALMTKWFVARKRQWIKTLIAALQIFMVKHSDVHLNVPT